MSASDDAERPPFICGKDWKCAISMTEGDKRDDHHLALLARLAPQLSRRGKLAFYSGVFHKDKK